MDRLDTFIGGPAVAMAYLQVNHIMSTNYMYQCHDPIASSRFVSSLKYLLTLSSLSSPNTTHCDDGRKWTTQRCSAQDIALCVNCDNPCEEPGATYLNSCDDNDTRENELKVLSFKFNTTIPGPSLSNLVVPAVSIQKDQAIVEVDINVVAYVYCDIYTSMSAAQSATYEILVSRGVASFPSSFLRASMTFVELRPSSTYYVTCTAEVDPKTSLSLSSDLVITSFSTRCCIPFFVDISFPRQVLVNSYVSSFVHVSSDKWPLTSDDGITLTPTLQSSSGEISDCLFSPSSLDSVDAIDADSGTGGVFVDIHTCSIPSTAPYTFSFVISGVKDENYEFKYTSLDLSVKVVAEEDEIDPLFVNAMFKNNLNVIELKFDRPIQADKLQLNPNILSNSFICSDLFAFEGADTDKCTFSNDRSFISIALDYNSVLLPTDTITLLSAKLTASSISQTVNVLPPLLTKYPTINVVSRNEIGVYQRAFIT